MATKPVLAVVPDHPTHTDTASADPDPVHQRVQLIWVRACDLVPSDDNLRHDLTDIAELAASIAAVGILEPLSVVPLTDGLAGPWQIVAGHRRHAAVQDLIDDGRWPDSRRLPCTIGTVAEGEEARVVAQLVENLQRVDLDPIDEANGYRRLVEHGWANTRIAAATGRNKDRVAGRLKLLRLPARWQDQLRTGALTLDFATKLAAAPTEVIDRLGNRPAPSPQSLELAIADHKVVQARTLVQQACKTRDLTLSTKSRWQLESDHTLVTKTTPAGLGKVLLPDDTPGMQVILQPVYPGPSKFDVFVYAPQVLQPTAPQGELGAAARWRETCRQLEREHRAATDAWKKSCKEFLEAWVPTVSADLVAEAAIYDTLEAYETELEDAAERVGWHKPPEDLDFATAAAAFTEWMSVPRNRTATLALIFADLPGDNPVAVASRTALELAGLPRPADLVLPPNPSHDPTPAEASDADVDQVAGDDDDPDDWDDDDLVIVVDEDLDVDEGGDVE